MSPRVVILASGSGTTAETFIRASASGQITSQVAHIIVSRRDAGVFERVQSLNAELGVSIPCTLINHRTNPATAGESVAKGQQSKAEQRATIDLVRTSGADAVILMGYMKRLGPDVVRAFGWHKEYTSPYQAIMLNTHPGLLPLTKGLHGIQCQEKMLELGLSEAGQTLHVVSDDYDDGPTVAEHRVAVKPGDTPEGLFDRVQAIEKQYIAQDIEEFILSRQKYLKGEA